MDGQSKQLIKNSSWVFLSNMIGAGFGFLRSIAIARGLGAEIFGSYAMVLAFVGLVQEFINLNLGTAIIKFGAGFVAQNRLDKLTVMIRRSINLSFIMCGLSVLIVALLTTFSYNTFIRKPDLQWFVIAFALAASVQYFNLITASVLRLFFKFKLNSIIQIILDVIETGVVVVAVLLYPQNISMFFVAAIVTRFLNGFICNLIGFWEIRKELWIHRHASKELIVEEEGQIRKFIINNSIGGTLKAFIQQGDVLLLGTLSSAVLVGYYSVAKKLAYSILTLTDPFVNSIYPQLSKLVAERRIAELKKMLFKISKLAAGPSVVFLVICLLMKSWIIKTVFGVEYEPAAFPFFFLVINAVIGSLAFWTLPLVLSLGLVQLRLKTYISMIVVGFLTAWILIPQMQASGMAVAVVFMTIISEIIFISSSFSYMRKFAPVSV